MGVCIPTLFPSMFDLGRYCTSLTKSSNKLESSKVQSNMPREKRDSPIERTLFWKESHYLSIEQGWGGGEL
jgi:hypothetical protein